ncbi:MAG TPA: hypothetical protein VK726_05480 [Acetobacteraceae bacterium]|jgi:hypothetical protein|nr:hypothetical protein [Acetobacteraceae bacterium]
MKRRLLLGGVLGLAVAVPALAQPPLPYGPVPPPRYEAVPPPPGTRYVWEPGHWHWNGVRYVWFGGHYVIREARYHHWVEGRWVWSPPAGRWVWRAAHWE